LGRKPDKEGLEELVIGELKDDSQIERYRSLASLKVPKLADIAEAANVLVAAALENENADREFREGEGRSLEILKLVLALPTQKK